MHSLVVLRKTRSVGGLLAGFLLLALLFSPQLHAADAPATLLAKFEIGPEIPIKLSLPGATTEPMGELSTVVFTDTNGALSATLRGWMFSGPKTYWSLAFKVLDAQGSWIANKSLVLENSGVIETIASRDTFEKKLELGPTPRFAGAARLKLEVLRLAHDKTAPLVLSQDIPLDLKSPAGNSSYNAELASIRFALEKDTLSAELKGQYPSGPQAAWEVEVKVEGRDAGDPAAAPRSSVQRSTFQNTGLTKGIPSMEPLKLRFTFFNWTTSTTGTFTVQLRPVANVGEYSLSYVDDTAEGKMSIAAGGHMVEFERKAKEPYLKAVQIFAGRYGMPDPPQEDFHVYVLNAEQQVLADVPVAYGKVERADLRWYRFETPAVELPQRFGIALAFNPHQTKGIYLGKDQSVTESHSYIGLSGDSFKKVGEKYDWMVRVETSAEPPQGGQVLKLADWQPPKVEAPLEGRIELAYDRGASEGKQSYGGAGPAVQFTTQDNPNLAGKRRVWVQGVRLYASRYGSGYPPESTMLHVSVLGPNGQAVGGQDFPYSRLGYNPRWVDLAFSQPVALPAGSAFTVAIDPEAGQYKGIYFHYTKASGSTHALKGTAGRFQPASDREWMIRAAVAGE